MYSEQTKHSTADLQADGGREASGNLIRRARVFDACMRATPCNRSQCVCPSPASRLIARAVSCVVSYTFAMNQLSPP